MPKDGGRRKRKTLDFLELNHRNIVTNNRSVADPLRCYEGDPNSMAALAAKEFLFVKYINVIYY